MKSYPLYHNTLCPKLWTVNEDGAKLDNEVRNGLLKVAQDFVKELKDNNNISIEVDDIVIIGSATNYNWTNYSDIDLHVVTDYKKLDMSAEDAQTLFDAIKVGWNNKHDITMKGHDVEIYVQDKAHIPTSASEYSVLNDKWLKEPVKENPKFDKDLIKKKYKEYKNKINSLVKKHDEAALKKLLEKLYKYRQSGLDKGGELSEENIVFKILRAYGHLDKIKDSISNIYDKKMSVKEVAVDNQSPAKQLIRAFKAPDNVQIDIMAYGPNTVGLESLFIEPEHRSFGRGTETLKQLTDLADKFGVAIELEIGADEAEIDLVRWYEKFGFKSARGFWRREPSVKENVLDEGAGDIAYTVFKNTVNSGKRLDRSGNTMTVYGTPSLAQMKYLKGQAGSFMHDGSKVYFIEDPRESNKIKFTWRF
jgi:GNAT superfamily N-acetyltransferase